MAQSVATWTPLTAGDPGSASVALLVLLGLAGVGSAVVLGIALAALVRRRSRSYLLLAMALATLLARTAVAVLSLTGSVAEGSHHLLEHGLDAVMAALVVAAVYDARAVRQSVKSPANGRDASDGIAGVPGDDRTNAGGDDS